MKRLRPFASEGLTKHGYAIQQVKTWRAEQMELGRPSSFEDFFVVHGLCLDCFGYGEIISGVYWIDADGIRHEIEIFEPGNPETIGSLHQRILKYAARWNYTYATCETCAGTGNSKTSIAP